MPILVYFGRPRDGKLWCTSLPIGILIAILAYFMEIVVFGGYLGIFFHILVCMYQGSMLWSQFRRFLTIFGKIFAVFLKKNNVMIIILHNFALSWVKSTNFFAKFFGENIFKNHNIGPRKGRRPWLDIGKWRKNVFLWDVGVSAAEYSKLTNGQDGEICWDSLKPKACKKKTRNGMEFAKNFPLMPS
jgi:hypothetical protein